MSRAVMQQALEALEMVMSHGQAVQKAKDTLRAALAEPEQEPVNKYCCHACFNKSGQFFLDRMILCPKCGNKRCPKASHHDLPCTNSNEPGQEGSIYTAPTQRKPQTTHWEGCEAVHPECRKPEQEPDGISWLKRDSGYFTAPTPRKPLTDEEMRECAQAMNAEPLAEGWPELIKFARAIENKHGIGEQHE